MSNRRVINDIFSTGNKPARKHRFKLRCLQQNVCLIIIIELVTVNNWSDIVHLIAIR
jgi:hypothetical protein